MGAKYCKRDQQNSAAITKKEIELDSSTNISCMHVCARKHEALIALGGTDGLLSVFEVNQNLKLSPLIENVEMPVSLDGISSIDEIKSLVFSHDASLIAVGGKGRDGTVLVYSIGADNLFLVHEFSKSGVGEINSIVFSDDSKFLAIGGTKGIARVYFPELSLPSETPLKCIHGLSEIKSHLLY